jgi:hypothetical protein
MTKEQENEAIAAHHLPIRIKELEAQVVTLAAERDTLREALRDRFAMAALTGFTSGGWGLKGCPEGDVPVDIFAEDAFAVADAMMEARKK